MLQYADYYEWNGIEGDGDGLIRIQGADEEEGRRNRCTAECKLITVSGGWWLRRRRRRICDTIRETEEANDDNALGVDRG